jgi:hypothetical protein
LKRTSAASLALLAPLAVLAAWLAWRSRGWPLVHDAPIMHYIAWRLGEGAVPYRDLFDMNFPGVYLLHRAALAVFGAGDAGFRAFDLLWLAGTALCVGALVAPWGRAAAAAAGLFFAVYHLAGGAWQAGQRDFVLCPFLLLAVLGVARWAEGRAPRTSLAGGALALGAGITIKPHAAALAAGLLVAIALLAWRAGVSPWMPAALFAAGVALIPAAVGAWVAARGALGAWSQIVFDYLLPLYSRLGRPAQWTFPRWHVWIAIGAGVALSLGAVAVRGRFTARHALAGLGLGYGLLHFFGQGKGWEYHLYPLAAFAAAVLFAEAGRLVGDGRALAATPLIASLAAAFVLLAAKGVEAGDAAWIAAKERRVSAVVGELAGRLGPGDTVQVLDTTDGGVHALLRLGARQPTRFLYDFHFYHDVEAPQIRALRAELAAAFDARPPRFVVLFERGWPAGGYERVARFPELAERLGRYRVDARRDGYVVYAR